MKIFKVIVTLTVLFVLGYLTVSCGPAPHPNPSTTSTETTAASTPNGTIVAAASDILDVYFIDVGQGDSILIDHEETNVSLVCANFMASAAKKDSQGFVGKRGDIINAGDLSFTVLSPTADPAATANDNSLVLSLRYGTVDFLFTGDAGEEVERSMTSASDIPLSGLEILKAGWHGCREASSTELLNVIKPEIAVYMAGEIDRLGYPHQETLDRLAQAGAKVFGTDINGTIIIKTDGITYEVIPDKSR